MAFSSSIMDSTSWVDPALEALSLPLGRGADFSELYFEDNVQTRLSHDGSQISASSVTHMHGAGLYLMSGTETRYGYTNGTDAASLRRLAEGLGSMVPWRVEAPVSTVQPVTEITYEPANPILRNPDEVPMADKKAMLDQAIAIAHAYSPKVVDAHADYQDRMQDVAVLNSEGTFSRERRVVTTLRFFVTVSDGVKSSGNWTNYSFAAGFEALDSEEALRQIVEPTVQTALDGLVAKPIKAGYMPVVVDSGTFIHEDCGHPLESTHLKGGVFAGLVGQQVASPLVTVCDGGVIPGYVGTNAMSDEGVPSATNVLIEDGVLRNYMIDRLGSRQLGMPQTAAGRRQDYRFAPVARMTNTYVRRGTTPTEDIIPSVDYGLYVREVGGGNVDPVTGKFNFLASSGNIIEHGELTDPISNVNMSGRSIDALKRVAAVGDRYFRDTGALCGADSGLIYVTAFMPRILIDGMQVG